MERKKIVFLAEVAILAALILLMSFTPLGYLRLPGLSVSLLMIPVAIGAVVVGPAAGAILGCLFGLTSFAQCFMGDVLGGYFGGGERVFRLCGVRGLPDFGGPAVRADLQGL